MNSRARHLIRSLLLVPALVCAASAWAQSAHRIDPQDQYHYWIRLNTKVSTNLPNSGLNLSKPGCAAVTYTIGSDGVPMNVRLAKLVPRSDLGDAAVTAVKNFRYGPSLTNRIGQPIDTYYIVPFNAPDGPDGMQRVMEPCKLPGYGQ